MVSLLDSHERCLLLFLRPLKSATGKRARPWHLKSGRAGSAPHQLQHLGEQVTNLAPSSIIELTLLAGVQVALSLERV